MGLFDSYAASDSNARFIKAFEDIAKAAKTAAEAYAKKTNEANITVNVNYDPSINNINDIAAAVKRAVRVQDR